MRKNKNYNGAVDMKNISINDKKTLECLIKLINHESKGGSDYFYGCGTGSKNKLIGILKKDMLIPIFHTFFIWDIIGSFSREVLTESEYQHIKYVYEKGSECLIENAKACYDRSIQ
jgi:hypothetical protein